MEEEPLAGGNMSGVVRVGGTVHRAAGPWSPTIHRLLRHVGAGVPQPVGFDERGREVLTFLEGTVPQDPMPAWVWGDEVLLAAGRRLAELHAATVHFGTDGDLWQTAAHEPREVVCHNDFAPYNLVFDGRHQLVGVIDWDMASPGPRVWDLGYLAYRLVPLGAPSNPDLLQNGPAERRRRLDLLCAAYGHGVTPSAVARTAVDRLHDLADLTAARHAAGAHHLTGHADLYRTDAIHLTTQLPALGAAVVRTAVGADLEVLRGLFRRSSLSNEEDRAALLANPECLEWSGETIAAGHTRVAVDGDIVGFATAVPFGDGEWELEDLFVEPGRMRQGVARRLVEDMLDRAAAAGVRTVWVSANPEAMGFYTAVGFVPAGTAPTRFGPVPWLRLDVRGD